MPQHMMVKQAELLEEMLHRRAHTIERDEDRSARLHHPPALAEHLSDRLFVAVEVNDSGRIDDRLVNRVAHWQRRGLRWNEVKPAPAFGVPDHLGTEIHAVAL